MAVPRKTANVEAIRLNVNSMLAGSMGDSEADQARRQGMIDVLEPILHASSRYNGFGYLEAGDVPNGVKPGIIMLGDDNSKWFPKGKTDKTRVNYF